MVGIIAEYNPFHNGHIYHIQKVKELFPDKIITLVLIGHFLNRGDVSIINKWDKVSLALEYGIDLVVELPFIFASQAADIYAYGAISILDHLGCEAIVFGSESNDIAKLTTLATIEETNEFQTKLKEYLKNGKNYPTALSKTIQELTSLEIKDPNDLLGVSYIKAILKRNSAIKPITIQRTNSYHDTILNNYIASASSIRAALKEKKEISPYVPKETLTYLQDIDLEELFPILKHQVLIENISIYQTVDEKLAHAMKNKIMESQSIEELISSIKTKNYTYNRIKRSIIHILCGLKKEEVNKEITYIRVLGFNQKGKNYLHKIKKKVSIPIYTTYHKDMALELRATQVYAFLTKDDIIKKETSHKPIIK